MKFALALLALAALVGLPFLMSSRAKSKLSADGKDNNFESGLGLGGGDGNGVSGSGHGD